MSFEQHCALGVTHKVLTYVEYRAVSEAFQNIDPPPPILPKRRGRTHSPGGEGVGGQYFGILEDARHWIGLLPFNSSTESHQHSKVKRLGHNRKKHE